MLKATNKLAIAAVILATSAFVGQTSFAEEQQSATAQLGLAIPLIGDLTDVADPGIFLGAQAMHQVDARTRYGIGVSYYSFGKDSADNVNTEVSMISTLAMTHHNLTGKSNNTPFIEGGFGFTRTQVNIAQSNAGGAAVTKGSNQEDISPTILFGVGFDTPAAYGSTFGMSVDYQHFFFKVGAVSGGGTLSLNMHLRV